VSRSRSSFDAQMNRAFKKYLFLLCILIVNGFNSVYADTLPKLDPYIPISNFTASGNSDCEMAEGLPIKVFGNTNLFEVQQPIIAEVADVEEEEEESDKVLFSLSQNKIYGGLLTAVFYAQMSGHFLSGIENSSIYFKPHAFASPCKRHIKFQVFRI